MVSGTVKKHTPEERVRQAVLRKLLDVYGYQKHDLEVELLIRMGSDQRRCDISAFLPGEPHTQHRAYIIFECKKAETPDWELSSNGQLESYLSASPSARWGVKTNGRRWIVIRKEMLANGTIDFVAAGDIPHASAPGVPFMHRGEAAQLGHTPLPPPAQPAAEHSSETPLPARKRTSASTTLAGVVLAVVATIGYMAMTADNEGDAASTGNPASTSPATACPVGMTSVARGSFSMGSRDGRGYRE